MTRALSVAGGTSPEKITSEETGGLSGAMSLRIEDIQTLATFRWKKLDVYGSDHATFTTPEGTPATGVTPVRAYAVCGVPA